MSAMTPLHPLPAPYRFHMMARDFGFLNTFCWSATRLLHNIRPFCSLSVLTMLTMCTHRKRL